MTGKILANRYRLTDQIGMGGMAIVYRAVDLRTGHNVAVKVLRPEYNEDREFISRFQREAEAASKMTHHNIVNLLDVGMDGENRYLVMEYVQGKTLKAVAGKTECAAGLPDRDPDSQRAGACAPERDCSSGYKTAEHPGS